MARPRPLHAVTLLFIALCASCARQAHDPIAGVPAQQHRVISRKELDWRWPVTAGTGTLGCVSGAVVFRAGGVDYAVNDEAKARGFASIEPLRVPQSSGPPRNPLKGIRQDLRMRIFAEARACDRTAQPDRGGTRACRQGLREKHGLSEADLQQIEAEGEERVWPPLVRGKVSLDPLTAVGLQLCGP